MKDTMQKAVAAYNTKINIALSAARAHGPMVQGRVTRELVRQQAAESNVSNLLAAMAAGLKDGMEDPALRPYCEMAKDEIERAMERISLRHPNRIRIEA